EVANPKGGAGNESRFAHRARLVAEKVHLDDGGGLQHLRIGAFELEAETGVANAEDGPLVAGGVVTTSDDAVAGEVVEAFGGIMNAVELDEAVELGGKFRRYRRFRLDRRGGSHCHGRHGKAGGSGFLGAQRWRPGKNEGKAQSIENSVCRVSHRHTVEDDCDNRVTFK